MSKPFLAIVKLGCFADISWFYFYLYSIFFDHFRKFWWKRYFRGKGELLAKKNWVRNLFGSKKNWSEIFLGQKWLMSGEKIGTLKNFGRKFCWDKQIWVKTKLGHKSFLGSNKIWVWIFFGSKSFLVKKNVRSKKIWFEK